MRKSIKGVQIFSFITLTLTIILWIALWAASAVPATASGQHTDKVTSIVDEAFNVSDKVNEKLTTYKISVGVRDYKSRYYKGDTAESYVSYDPSGTKDRDVIYSVSNTNIATVDEKGLVTFNNVGTVILYATLKSSLNSDNVIKAYIYLRCYGENPLDPDYPERLKFDYLTDSNESANPTVGERRRIVLNNGKSDLELFEVSTEDEDILFYWRGYLYGRKEGETKITYKFKDEDGEDVIYESNINVGSGTIHDINLVGKSDNTFIHGAQVNKNTLLEIPSKQGQYYDCMVESSDKAIATLNGPTYLRMNGIGEATLTYISCYDPTKTVAVHVKVEINPPKSMRITGPDALVCHDSYSYSISVSPMNYASETTWTVVKGKGTITPNGRLTAEGYGTIVIRCTSNYDESLYVEKEIKVKLFQSAYGFVRKAMGHAGLSAVLGFGIFGTLWLLLRRRYLIITALPIAYFYAYISEFIQKFTPGRFASLNDVFIDFAGAVIGMFVAVALTELVCFIWRIVNKEGYRKFRSALRLVNFKTLFTKTSKLEFQYENMHIVEPADENESELTTTVLPQVEMGEMITEVLATDTVTSDNDEKAKNASPSDETEEV